VLKQVQCNLGFGNFHVVFTALVADGIRKMRNLLLFHDILVCAKQKLSRNHVKLEYKWYLPLAELQFHPYVGAESKGVELQ